MQGNNSFENNKLVKVIKSFCVVGLDTEHIYYEGIETKKLYINRIDMIKSQSIDINDSTVKIDDNEIWIRITEESDFFIRLFLIDEYDHENPPITDIKILDCEFFNNEYIVSLS